jgi:7-carboxy-7-deazaguanine synthase
MNAPFNPRKTIISAEHRNQQSLINISEIFGPTIQGEGALIGTQTIFVRTGGCDYRCDWCDTAYAVLPKFENDWQAMDAGSIFKEVKTLSNNQPMWVTLSGGNPAIQNLELLIKMGQRQGYKFSMETQGSIAKSWFSLLDQLTLSPKPPSSGMHFKAKGLKRCLDAATDTKKNHPIDISFKFVVADEKDLIWAKLIADKNPDISCFVQPCNTQAKLEENIIDIENTVNSKQLKSIANNQQESMLWLIKAVQNLNWQNTRILPQLHTWLWGNQTGV